MKLIVNENFQFKGVRRAGATLTISSDFLEKEIKKGRHENVKRGRHPWLSGLLEHCIPANQSTADFISKVSGKTVEPLKEEHNEEDDSEEIMELRAEFEAMGKGYDKRWKLETLRNRLIKAKKETGLQEEKDQEEAEDFRNSVN